MFRYVSSEKKSPIVHVLYFFMEILYKITRRNLKSFSQGVEVLLNVFFAGRNLM